MNVNPGPYFVVNEGRSLKIGYESSVTKNDYTSRRVSYCNEYTEGFRNEVIFSNIDSFRDLKKVDLQSLASMAERIVYNDNDVIISEGDEGDSMFVVVHGILQVRVKDKGVDVDVDVDVARLGVHDYFGEMSLLTGLVRSATVVALNRVVLLEIKKAYLKPIIDHSKESLSIISSAVAKRQLKNKREIESQRAARVSEVSATESLMHEIERFFGLV